MDNFTFYAPTYFDFGKGAMGALMSGSGPTVFGIYDSEKEAMRAKEICRALPCRCFVYVTDLYR